ncbi:methyltransferase [Aquidulcibacter paucihalophilus]|uniref:methyltransferase n=1 Tax=Aquidulcibacter paucihalophilus TaxID=1978549 RepID=UPI000A18C87D|nr:methyltransferase [Aquidulcibacter paucihalophilus]
MIPRSWLDAWTAWRNRLVSSPSFQRWAAGFFLTRPIAHTSADRLFGLVAGFVYSQVLLACVQLRLPELLSDGPKTTQALAEAMDLPLVSAARLLTAAQSLDLVELAGADRYALGMQGAALLGNAGLGDMIRHHALFYADLADPVALLKQGGGQGQLASFWPYAAYDRPDQTEAAAISPYSALMGATQPMIASDILDAYPLTGHQVLMDVGGGEGAFAAAAARHAPHLNVRVFDLPAVADRARAAFEASQLTHRAQALGGNFLDGVLPKGADIISLVRILHDHDEPTVMKLLRAAHTALPANGVLMIAEPMSGFPARDPMAEAYFGFYLMAMGRGKARTPAEISAMARAAGFSRIVNKPTRTPMLVRVLIAYP